MMWLVLLLGLFLFFGSSLGSGVGASEGYLTYPWQWYHPRGYQGYRGYYGGRRGRRYPYWGRRWRYPYYSYGYYGVPTYRTSSWWW